MSDATGVIKLQEIGRVKQEEVFVLELTAVARRVQKRMTGFGGGPPSLDQIKAILYAAEREHLDHHGNLLAERDRLRMALGKLWAIVVNDVACPVENPCSVCAPVYARVREALDGE